MKFWHFHAAIVEEYTIANICMAAEHFIAEEYFWDYATVYDFYINV